MEPVRVGVIGCGVMGAKHAEVAAKSEGLALAAVADVRREAAEAVAKEHGAGAVYDDVDALLADRDVEVVVIALPTGIRTPIALKALAAGKHVLLEKPVAMNVDEVKRMMSAAGDDLTVGVCSCRYRFWKSAEVATQLVADGELGDLRVVHFRGMLKDGGPKTGAIPPWRVSRTLNGGGFWVNWACYDLDFLMGVTGWRLRPRTVLAQTWPIAPHLPKRVAEGSDAEEHAIALVQCEDGAVLSVERGESLSIDTDSRWEVIGTKASLRLNMLQAQGNRVLIDRTHPDGPLTTEVAWEGDSEPTRVHWGPLQDFGQAIRQRRPPMTPLRHALTMQQITDAIYQSADEGRAVEIE